MEKLQNRYKILRELGSGGFGVTYLAEDHQRPGHPQCVVKELYPDQALVPKIRDLFAREAGYLETLGRHSHIPQLLAHFEESRRVYIFGRDRRFYIVQEYIEGSPLSAEIYPGKQRSQGYVLDLLRECLETLAFVHDQGVIHRDIKPDNLMRRQSDQRIFLIDFGAVKQLTPTQMAGSGSVSRTVMIGTPGYMPYEQYNGKPRQASDVYALGMTAIAALTGKHPADLDEDPRTGEIQWRRFAKVDPDLGDFLDKMVRYRHHERYSSASTALAALNQLSGLPQRPRVPSPPPVAPKPYPPMFQVPVLKTTLATAPAPSSQFEFETVRVNDRGKVAKRQTRQADFFTQDLGGGVTLDMLRIPEGEFVMGSPESEEGRFDREGPQRRVQVPEFFMGRFAVTQAQYQRITGENPSRFTANGGSRPVELVSWDDATAFCQKLSEQTGRTYRLPSEAEWEYACRAGTDTPFHFGSTLTPELANYRGTERYGNGPTGVYREETTAVGSFPANDFGLFDMHSNVWEWCEDVWHENYRGGPTDGSAWTQGGDQSTRMGRGGSWIVIPRSCRSAFRSRFARDSQGDFLGFRLVCLSA